MSGTLQPVLMLAQLRRLEGDYRHLPLMERAGEAAATEALALCEGSAGPVAIFAGPGNNGGDALVVARRLHERQITVHVVGVPEHSRWTGEAAQALAAFQLAGLAIHPEPPADACLIVDGVFGIGLSRPPAEPWRAMIESIAALAGTSGCPILALDCPSGLDAASGQAFMPVVTAERTITFLADKPGLHTADGPDHAGEVVVADLGLDLLAWLAQDEAAHPQDPAGRLLAPDGFAAQLRPRRRNTHKGSFGSAGILGGAPSMVGAALLAARAALKLGCGRVYAGLLDPQAPRVDQVQPEIMLRAPDGLLQAPLTALAIGPGLGDSAEAVRLLHEAVAKPIPLVVDADALTLLAQGDPGTSVLAARRAATVLTPHPAEAARLLGTEVATVQSDRVGAARALADRHRAHVVLKGCGSVLAAVDGRWWISPAGTPALATAGTGDVLTGLITALLAQGWPPLEAMLAGTFLHGRGAERWCATWNLGSGLTASELIDACRQEFGVWMARGASCAAHRLA